MAVMVLEPELETYDQHKEELLGTAAGKWVLIRGQEIAGTFDTQDDAISEGYRRFGNVPFLVKQILAHEAPEYFTSNLIAV
jgi:hypothetical protein